MKILCLILLLIQTSFAQDIKTCGGSVTVENSITECKATFKAFAHKKFPVRASKNKDSLDTLDNGFYSWDLVARTFEGNEVWKDETPYPYLDGQKRKRIWTEHANIPVYWQNAINLCSEPQALQDIKANLSPVDFMLPSKEDFLAAKRHGFLKVLHNIAEKYIYWTNFQSIDDKALAVAFDISTGLTGRSKHLEIWFLCVGIEHP